MFFVPAEAIIGPFVRFTNYDPSTYEYSASVLVVLNPQVPGEPELTYEAEPEQLVTATKLLLDSYQGFTFWRFSLDLTLLDDERTVQYRVAYGEREVTKAITVPGRSQNWHWFFYSCNGFHEPSEGNKLDGILPLWKDVNAEHRKQAFHVQVGGGDQIYNDPVWNRETLKQWLAIDKDTRVSVGATPEMEDDLANYYFTAYAQHFSTPEFADALAAVPFVFTWDDHDIFDGYGSYPDNLQNCPVFQAVFAAAKRFYLLFQQHATESNIQQLTNTFGSAGGFHEIKLFGSSVALWAMDNRTERSIDTIVHTGSHEIAKQKLLDLPPTVRHVIVLATVPVVYPELPAEGAFSGIQSGFGFFGMLASSTGLAKKLENQFGLVDLLDDIIDHWSASSHQEERKLLISNMQEVAFAKQVRVTFISGDVHSAGIGRFYSYPKRAQALTIGSGPGEGETCEDFRDDARFMANITSSAMGNTPMPAGLVNAYNKMNTAADVPGLQPTREKMVRRFHGGTEKVLGVRNYCTVEEYPYDPSSDAIENGTLMFTLRGENRKKSSVDVWHNFVPILTTTQDLWAGATRSVELLVNGDDQQD